MKKQFKDIGMGDRFKIVGQRKAMRKVAQNPHAAVPVNAVDEVTGERLVLGWWVEVVPVGRPSNERWG
jgi:hypothetical protein